MANHPRMVVRWARRRSLSPVSLTGDVSDMEGCRLNGKRLGILAPGEHAAERAYSAPVALLLLPVACPRSALKKAMGLGKKAPFSPGGVFALGCWRAEPPTTGLAWKACELSMR